MKSEPSVYSIDDLARDGVTPWEGVRNYQARNFMRAMTLGDRVFFYHSNANPSGIAGVAEVSRLAYPDSSAFNPKSPYFDPASTLDNPRWFMVDVRFVEKWAVLIPLETLKKDPELAQWPLVKKGSRLSVMPVEAEIFKKILKMSKLPKK